MCGVHHMTFLVNIFAKKVCLQQEDFWSEWGIDVKTYSPVGAIVITVYDSASSCLTFAYKQNKNNYCILELWKERLVVYFFRILLHLYCVSSSTFQNMPQLYYVLILHLTSVDLASSGVSVSSFFPHCASHLNVFSYLLAVHGCSGRGRCLNGKCETLCEYHNLTSCQCDQGICCVHSVYAPHSGLRWMLVW